MRKLLMLLVMALFSLGTTGCVGVVVGAGAGAGTMAYMAGEAKTMIAAPLASAVSASEKALKDLQFTGVSATSDAFQGKVLAVDAATRSVSVKLKKVTDSTTEVRVRVGVMGDKAVSAEIISKIRTGV